MSNKKVHLILNIALIVSLVGVLATLYLTRQFLGQQSESLSLVKAEEEAAKTQLTNLNRAEQQLKKYPNLETEVKTALPGKDQSNDYQIVVQLAQEAGIDLGNLGIGTTVTSNNQQAAQTGPCPQPLATSTIVPGTCILAVRGNSRQAVSYDQLQRFLKSIESNERRMQVSSIIINKDGVGGTKLQFTIEINLYLKQS